ncbi:hypothetical protein SVAN01_11063 [Stagonosporopsis vannaccii]|nr:hypothetical protein SVAN01_11063 [Stagonosporopsis vannaccii]
MASTLILAFVLGAAAAQSTTLSLPFYVVDTQSIDASVVSANPSATTMALACPPGTDSNNCGLFPEMTLVYGPSTYHLDMGVGDANAFTGTADCARGATVTCTEFAAGSEANFPGSSTVTYEGTDIVTIPVTVTAGAEKLGNAQATATQSAVSTTSATSGTAASTTTASVTQIVGTNSHSTSDASRTQSAAASPSPGAGRTNFVASRGGGVGVVVAVAAGLLL